MAFLARMQRILVLSPARCGRCYGPVCALVGACLASVVWATGVAVSHSQADAGPSTVVTIVHAERQPSQFLLQAPEPMTYRLTFGAAAEPSALCEPRFAVEAQPEERFIPIHQREDYRVESPDILSIAVGCGTLSDRSGVESLTAEYLVNHDGAIDLGGALGIVPVAGKTLSEIEEAVEQRLDGTVCQPQVDASVSMQNSHVYYVITERSGADFVGRFPVVGNETVLDALEQVGPLETLENKCVWIARPHVADGACRDSILPVRWQEVISGASSDTNYRLHSGDRIFVVAEGPLNVLDHALDQALEQFVLPLRKYLGLGSRAEDEECCACQGEACEKECE